MLFVIENIAGYFLLSERKIGGHLLVLGNGDKYPSTWYLSLALEVYVSFPSIPDLFKASTFHITDFFSDSIL